MEDLKRSASGADPTWVPLPDGGLALHVVVLGNITFEGHSQDRFHILRSGAPYHWEPVTEEGSENVTLRGMGTPSDGDVTFHLRYGLHGGMGCAGYVLEVTIPLDGSPVSDRVQVDSMC